jgi:hypothetical protein
MLKPQYRSSPWSTHISTDGRPTLSTLTHAKLNIIKMKDLYDSQDCRAKNNYPCMNPNHKVWALGNSIKACREMSILEREREHIGSIWSRITCLAIPLATAQNLGSQVLEDF